MPGPPFLVVLLTIAFYAALIGAPIYLGLRFLRAYERRAGAQGVDQALAARVELLEEEVRRLSAEVERVEDGQRFLTALGPGAARPDAGVPAPTRDATALER